MHTACLKKHIYSLVFLTFLFLAILNTAFSLENEQTDDNDVPKYYSDDIYTFGPVDFGIKEPEKIPVFYRELIVPGIEARVFAFMNTDGLVQLRAYGKRSEQINNKYIGDVKGYWPISITIDSEQIYQIWSHTDDGPVIDTEVDLLVPNTDTKSIPAPLPHQYTFLKETGVYTTFDNNGNQMYRIWAETSPYNGAYFPCDSSGNISPGEIPVYIDEEVKNLLPTYQGGTDLLDNVFPVILDNGLVLTVIKQNGRN